MTLSVTTAATDLTLLTVAERRAAVDVTDNSKDAELLTLEARVAAMITAACGVVPGGTATPTLRLETLTETLRLSGCARSELILSRMPIVSVTSLTEIDTALEVDGTDFEIEKNTGVLRRLSSDVVSTWSVGKIVIVYTAGWTTVPDDLKLAAVKFMQAEWQQGSRDPLLMSKRIDGVSEYQWKVDMDKDSVIPLEVMDILHRGGYVNNDWIG